MPYPYLVADVGGTNARFALVDEYGELSHIDRLATADFPTLEAAIRAYLEPLNVQVVHAGIAIANPVTGDEVRMTNHHWSFSIRGMQASLGFDTLHVINDFTAQALSILQIKDSELRQICAGHAAADAPKVVIGPGTGLGVSGLIPDGRGQWIALAGEGGHASFAPRSAAEGRIFAYARKHFPDHVSAERLICGSGLALIDAALAAENGIVQQRSPAEVTAAALAGEARALSSVNHFSAMLATIASDVALTLGAHGGVYLCGGILPRIVDLFVASPFAERFSDKGRFGDYLADVPVWLVMDAQEPGLSGAAIALQQVLNGRA
ncbi:glucokinase [Cardiobacteriaceae bacterium TAE3-ERU3]|nr:glucokinase [Cardiobacteriaceae bacterium TAE3-ERU3]